MTNLRRILKENNIKNHEIYTLLGVSKVVFERKSGLKADFTIKELENIKSFLVDLDIVNNDYDIGEFLEESKEFSQGKGKERTK